MKTKIIFVGFMIMGLVLLNVVNSTENHYHTEFETASSSFAIGSLNAYPPGTGILTTSKNCVSCHISNGPWKDDANTIIDILDKDTKKSLRQNDGRFIIHVERGKQTTVLTVIGNKKNNDIPPPYRNAWLYIDTSTIGNSSLSKFPKNWEVNVPMSCRIVGDNLQGYEDAHITALPMTIKPGKKAKNAVLTLQVMLTSGQSKKGNAKEGLLGSYFERIVELRIIK